MATATMNGRNGNRDLGVRGLLLSGGVGAGALVAYEILELVRTQPAAVIDVLKQFGGTWVLLMTGMAMLYSGTQKFVNAAKESAAAQQRMADAVGQLADRDDRRQQKLEIEIGYVGTKMDQVLDELGKLKRAVNDRATGATA